MIKRTRKDWAEWDGFARSLRGGDWFGARGGVMVLRMNRRTVGRIASAAAVLTMGGVGYAAISRQAH